MSGCCEKPVRHENRWPRFCEEKTYEKAVREGSHRPDPNPKPTYRFLTDFLQLFSQITCNLHRLPTGFSRDPHSLPLAGISAPSSQDKPPFSARFFQGPLFFRPCDGLEHNCIDGESRMSVRTKGAKMSRVLTLVLKIRSCRICNNHGMFRCQYTAPYELQHDNTGNECIIVAGR